MILLITNLIGWQYALDDNVKQNFLEPLHHLQTKDLKEVQPDQINMAVFFWYLVKSDLYSVFTLLY